MFIPPCIYSSTLSEKTILEQPFGQHLDESSYQHFAKLYLHIAAVGEPEHIFTYNLTLNLHSTNLSPSKSINLQPSTSQDSIHSPQLISTLSFA